MTEARPVLNEAALEQLLAGLLAIRDGDFGVRLPGSADPLLDDIATAFNDAAASLSGKAAARAQFLPTLSHELRTPLNSMLVLAGLFAQNADGNLTAEQVEYANVIHSAGTDLAGVIGALIDPDGSPGGGTARRPDEPDEPDGLDGRGEPPERAQERGLLVVEAARGGLLTLLARGAVSDLADAEGQVTVRTAARAAETAEALRAAPYRCVLLDMGVDDGLALEVLALAHARRIPLLARGRGDAERARFATLRAAAGADLAELLDSPAALRERIAWHLSAAPPGEGLTPRNGGTRDRTAPGSAGKASHVPLRGRKILVVDDDPRNVFAITSTLEFYGMRVVSAADGRTGIDQLRAQPDTDLVLMDLMMPGMDGYSAITAIRDIPEFSDLPIIAVTAHTMTKDSEIPGADGFLTKPLNPDELLSRMERCLSAL